MPFVITSPRRRNKPRKAAKRAAPRRSATRVVVVRAAPQQCRKWTASRRSSAFKGVPVHSWLRNRPKRRRRNPKHRIGTFKKGWPKLAAARGNPRRRRRNRARRANPFRMRRRNRRNAYRGFKKRHGRRNPPGLVAKTKGIFRDLFNLGTWGNVLGGVAGLSAALTIPKLLAQYGHASFGRGMGGVATSVVGTAVTAGVVSMFAPKAGKAILVGGLIGSTVALIAAMSDDTRKKILPFEEQLLAHSLPTSKGANPAMQSAIPDWLKARLGPAGVGRTSAQITQNEAAYRAALGLRGYVNSGQRRLGDYTQYAGASRVAGARGPEQF